MKRLFLFLGLSLIAMFMEQPNSRAQISHGGSPRYHLSAPKSHTPTKVAPAVANDLLIQEDLDQVHGSSPMRIGVVRDMHIDILKEAAKLQQADGSTVYRLAIASPTAHFISAAFDEYLLPEGAQLFLYDATGDFVLGSFIGSDVMEEGVFYTQAVPGDLIYIEYHEPAGTQSRLHLSDITHGYKDFIGDVLNQEKTDPGSSGGCSPDVACEEGIGWEKQARSVVCYTITSTSGYEYYCTGALINNTAKDQKPYVLSASHCQDGISVRRYTFYFNYEASICNGNDAPTTHSMVGATKISNHSIDQNGSDFLLLKINRTIPLEYQPYYAGWSRSNQSLSRGACIHHPSGDQKKISIPGSQQLASGSYSKYIYVEWNGHGVVEPGSSGSPLFNANGLIIGDLHGGNSSCDNQYGYDFYGRFSISWNGGGTQATRLKDHLDPLGVDSISLSGLDPFDTVSIATIPSRHELKLFPNPTSGDKLQLQADDNGRAIYHVYDMNGRLVTNGEANFAEGKQSINLNHLSNGSYHVDVILNGKRYSNLVVIRK